MTTNRKLTIGIIVLLIINLVILGLFITNHKCNTKGNPDNHQGPAQVIIKKLGFDDDQVTSLQTLKTSHIKEVRAKDKEIQEIKKVIFNSLGSEATVNIDSLSTMIGAIQKDIEETHYHHFLRIKALCREDQLPKFTELSKELSKLFSRPKDRAPQKKN